MIRTLHAVTTDAPSELVASDELALQRWEDDGGAVLPDNESDETHSFQQLNEPGSRGRVDVPPLRPTSETEEE